MGLRGEAAIVGIAEYAPERRPTKPARFTIEQWADLTALALDDAGLTAADVDGVVCSHIQESSMFVPSTIAEYCGFEVDFAERVDLGGATTVGMVWRAAAAIELGVCDVVVGALPSGPLPPAPEGVPHEGRLRFGASSDLWGSPQAEFDIPFGNVAQNCGYAMIAQRYGAVYGYDPRALAKIAADQRTSATHNPAAVFHRQPITIDDVLDSRMIADPLHLLEIVMPCTGGAAFVVARADRARDTRHRAARITGFGERVTHKTHSYMPDMTVSPLAGASKQAFAMAGVGPADVDVVELYDCYTITALLSIEDSGFCAKGEGQAFVHEHDLTYAGDFPCNTHGGQLGFGQPGMAGGASHVIEAVRQLRGDGADRQITRACDTAYVTGTGGILAEQAALVLQGA
jgi:acetyl-CoA C-acetyltransferase